MILDRTIPPPSKRIDSIDILKAEKHILDNQIPLYTIQAGEQSVLRLELIFEAGSRYETHFGTSFFTSKMLTGGTSRYNSTEINEYFDQFGAFLEINQSADRLSIMVYGLTQYLPDFLPMIHEMITDSVIPEAELEMQKTIAIQTLQVNLEKTAFVAGQIIRGKLYGQTHPYGRSQTQEVIQNINQEAVKEFYQNRIKNQPFKVFLSGKFDKKDIESINNVFGKIETKSADNQFIALEINPPKTENILVEKTESVQSTIRLGRVMFNRSHPDFFKFTVCNTIFGGFFGSRLMKNIREEKGFTYGISSALIPYTESGYLLIGTDVKKEFTQQTLDEIGKEISRLQNELVAEDELETAKNYMIGAFIGSLNTPFEVADKQKATILDDLPNGFYEKYIENIRHVSVEDVLEMAKKYYNVSELCEVVVGGK